MSHETPPEWEYLVGIAESALQPSSKMYYQMPAFIKVWESVRTLDDNAYGVAQYHGLGKIACAFGRSVATVAQKESLINSAVEKLSNAHQSPAFSSRSAYVTRERGLYVDEISGSLHDLGPTPAFIAAYKQLSIADRVVANVLETGLLCDLSRRPKPNMQQYLMMSQDNLPVRRVQGNVFGGSFSIMRLGLQRYYEQKTQQILNPLAAEHLLVADVASPNELRDLTIAPANGVAAGLRFDEFSCTISSLVQTTANGKSFIDRAHIPSDPGPSRLPDIVPHTDRIGCPALFGSSLIPLISRMTPEIIARTQERLLDGKS